MNSEIKYFYLKNHSLSSCLEKEQLVELATISKIKSFKKSEPIYFGGEGNTKIHFLIKGRIKVTEIDDFGKELIKDIINEGDFFGALGLEAMPPNDDFAIALTDSTIVCSFPLFEFNKIMEKFPILSLAYARSISSKLRKLETRHSNLVFKDVKARLISFFKDWAEREGKSSGENVIIKNYLTHSEIAGFIATSRQSVTQLLNELRDGGYLLYNRKQIEIKKATLLN